jgi:hypothetical protein
MGRGVPDIFAFEAMFSVYVFNGVFGRHGIFLAASWPQTC